MSQKVTLRSWAHWVRLGAGLLSLKPGDPCPFDAETYRAHPSATFLLSSPTTAVHQVLVPIFWVIVGVGAGAFAIGPARALGDVVPFTVLVGGFWLVGASFTMWLVLRLRIVWLVGDAIQVAGPSGTERIPLTAVRWVDITQPYGYTKLITLQLDHESSVGRRVTFVPVSAGLSPANALGTCLRQLVRQHADPAYTAVSRDEGPASVVAAHHAPLIETVFRWLLLAAFVTMACVIVWSVYGPTR
jgi:hypothetical protein